MATMTDPMMSPTAFETTQAACLRAMGMLASGRAWLVFLISLALLAQLGLFAAANWGDVLRLRSPEVSAFPGAAQPDQAAAASQAGEPADDLMGREVVPTPPPPNFLQDFWPPERWEQVMKIALPIAGFVALACAFALIVLMAVGIQVGIVGRLPALSCMVSAFYWSIITACLLFPWGSLIQEPLNQANVRVPWLFSTYSEIAGALAANADGNNMQALVWLRFLAWPVVALVVAWIAGARFGKGYWQMVGLAEMEAKARGEHVR
jgi:hypothetical protein